ncbi:unnamed protein product [Lasius platythorax]|uniref:Zinc finger PHD-type domain-containing protein n=1 Tax=Lasius platythorax TaxID=488582 RepID=A0AAV2MZB2_9HYME
MDGKRICKGCSTAVAKPIVCSRCGTASHPGCISRAGHPVRDGKFSDCITATASTSDALSQTLLDSIYSIIRSEFAVFKKELLDTLRADFDKINGDIQRLSSRIDKLENSELRLGGVSSEEEVLEEIAERERRSTNLIFFNLKETDASTDSNITDLDLVKDILEVMGPRDVPNVKISRLGAKRRDSPRPLRVSFPSKHEALAFLRDKKKYSGPVKIYLDRTPKQRRHLSELQAKLKVVRDAGENKIIRYFNGVPRIVNARHNAKNV